MKNNLYNTFESIPQKSRSKIKRGYRQLSHTDLFQKVVGFKCIVCHQPVNSDTLFSGVNNRNHCPYCLSSRHVDLFRAGDRLNACKSSMQPIALAWKNSRNKYGSSLGELMIVHLCNECDLVSINRIAADDSVERILDLFEATISMDQKVKTGMRNSGINLLEKEHEQELKRGIH